MVVFTSREANKLFGGNEGNQILSYIIRQGFGNKEYLVDGNWIFQSEGRVRGSRYNLNEVGSEIQDIAKIWNYIKNKSIQTQTKSDKVLEQLSIARLKPEKLRLFSPWGPRYNKDSPVIKESDLEISTLRELGEVFRQFKEKGYNLDFLLMPADAYGTEVNSLSEKFVEDYFKWLEEWAYKELRETEVIVKAWSNIRNEQKCFYDGLRKEIDQNFYECVGEGEYRNAVKVAKIFNPERAEESARRYCIERLVEGNIISKVYNPIKLSLVRKEKDSLDGPLKIIYIIKNRAPWLGDK